MRIKVEKRKLEAAVKTVCGAVPAKATMNILTCILIDAVGDVVKMAGTDLEIGISTELDALISQPGKLCVNGKKFHDFVAKLPDEVVTLSSSKDNKNLTITAGKTKLKLALSCNADDFPVPSYMEGNDRIIMGQASLKNAIRGVLFACDASGNGLIRGINVRTSDDKLFLCALDGHRIAVKQVKVSHPVETDLTVSGIHMREVSRLLSGDTDKKVYLSFDEHHIWFDMDTVKVTARLLDGKYYQYEKMFPEIEGTTVTVSGRDLGESMDRAMIFTSDINRKPVIFDISDEYLNISISTFAGQLNEDLDAVVEGEPLHIGFNPHFIMDILREVDDEDLELHFGSDSFSPLLISGDGYKYLVLPVSINEGQKAA